MALLIGKHLKVEASHLQELIQDHFRDCAFKNLMMDATSLYPDGFHPIRTNSLPERITHAATLLSRNDVPVTYYYVDFGISTWLKPEDTDRLVVGSDGLDQDVPELSDDVPYDPFKVDIFVLGNFFRENFTQVSTTFRPQDSVNNRSRNIQISIYLNRWLVR